MMWFAIQSVITLACVSMLQMAKADNISLLISLPLHQDIVSVPHKGWERGLEILPGALIAVDNINNNSSVLPGHYLQLIFMEHSCHEYEVLQQFFHYTFHNTHVNVVGVSGFLSHRATAILWPLTKHGGMLLNIAIDYNIQEDKNGFLALRSPSVTIETLLIFMRRMNWTRIGLITENTDAYFFTVAEMLLQMAEENDNVSISPYVQLLHREPAIHEIIKFNARVIFVSVNIRRAMQLICTVYEKGLLWPDYAWIFHSYTVEDFLHQQPLCDMKTALNGMIIIDGQLKSEPSDPQSRLISGITFFSYYEQYLSKLSETALEYNMTLNPNEYAKLLYDLVWETAIALNNSCHQIISCANVTTAQQFYQQYQWEFTISYKRNMSSILIGTVYYNLSVMEISLNDSILDSAPVDELPILTAALPLWYTIGVALQIALTGLFITLMLVLYIFFHKEPEIRATSFPLSLLMFAGCYLNLVYLILLYHSNHSIDSINIISDDYLCIFRLWLSVVGIPLPLMLAVLLLKMLRIYHIFNSEKVRLSHYCSDLSLAVFILLILSPIVLVHLVWVIVDRYQINVKYKIENGFNHIDKSCGSKYQFVWFGILCIYMQILYFALAIVAVITRKVRLEHFKDTKKVYVLLFILSFGILMYVYWLLLQTLNIKRYIVSLPPHIGHSVLIISFQSLLFVPKVFPPLWRYVNRKVCSKLA